MNTLTIILGEELFSFSDFDNWCDTAKRKFKKAGRSSESVLCIDSRGRICHSGKEFMRARDDGSFPVRAFAKVFE